MFCVECSVLSSVVVVSSSNFGSTQKYVEIYGMAFLDLENYNIKQRVRHLILTWMIWGTIEKKMTIKKELLNNI